MKLEHIEAWCTYLGKLLLIATPFVLAGQFAAQRWLKHTKMTRSQYDDRVASVLVSVFDFLAELVLVLPRVAVNLEALRSLARKLRSLPRPPAALLLLALLPFSVTTTGCSGFASQTVRSTLIEVDVYVDGINARVGVATSAARARAELADSREAYEEIMRPWERVSDAITGVQVALLGVATSVIAVDAGREGDVFGSIACAVQALTELTELLPIVGVDVPEKLEVAITWFKAFAGASCSSPPAPEPPPSAPAATLEVGS